MKKKIIFVSLYLPESTTCLVGVKCGQLFSKQFDLDSLEKTYDKLIFVIDEHIRIMNKSFFMEVFGERAYMLQDKFKNKYKFVAMHTNIEKRINYEFIPTLIGK